jgi:hypothetical protein
VTVTSAAVALGLVGVVVAVTGGGGASADRQVAAAARRTLAAGSVGFTMTETASLGGHAGDVLISTTEAGSEDFVRGTMNFTLMAHSLGRDPTSGQVLMTGNDRYERTDGQPLAARPWVHSCRPVAQRVSGPGGLAFEPGGLLGSLSALQSARRVGRERVGTVVATHFAGSVSPLDRSSSSAGKLSVDVWIGDDHQVRRLEESRSADPGRGALESYQVTLDLRVFGEAVHAKVPSETQIREEDPVKRAAPVTRTSCTSPSLLGME